MENVIYEVSLKRLAAEWAALQDQLACSHLVHLEVCFQYSLVYS